MIKILLYDTGDSRNENNEPLGIEVIGAKILNEFNSKVNVKLLWYNQDGVPKKIEDNFDIIGISLNIGRMEIFDHIYKMIKTLNHKPMIFVGNVVATYGYEYLLKIYKDIFCMIGEGEEVYVQIIKDLFQKNLKIEKINNLAFWNGGKIIITKRKSADLKNYIKPLRVFNDFLIKNKGIARIEGSRGCSWGKCNFCCVEYKYNSTFWREIAIKQIIEQIQELAYAGIKSIYFTDEDFIGNNVLRLEKMIEEIEREKNNNKILKDVNFFISVKPIDILDEKIFKLLQRFSDIGLREIFIGIESGSTEQLKRYNKCATKNINEKVMKKVKKIKTDIDLGYILFDPEMTVEELEENIKFIEDFEIYNWGSNFIKRLRIQTDTEFEKKFCAEKELEFDLNNLEYKYVFKDSKIQKIYELYKNINLDAYAYQLQNAYRGEVDTEKMRQEQKEKIVTLRRIQFLCLKKIYRSVINDEELCLDGILNEFQNKWISWNRKE